VMPSPTPSTPAARPSPLWMWCTLSSARAAPYTASAAKCTLAAQVWHGLPTVGQLCGCLSALAGGRLWGSSHSPNGVIQHHPTKHLVHECHCALPSHALLQLECTSVTLLHSVAIWAGLSLNVFKQTAGSYRRRLRPKRRPVLPPADMG